MENFDFKPEEIRDALKKSIPKMTALEMLVLYLKIEKGLPFKKIGDKLCMSHQMVWNHFNKAKSYIKKELEK